MQVTKSQELIEKLEITKETIQQKLNINVDQNVFSEFYIRVIDGFKYAVREYGRIRKREDSVHTEEPQEFINDIYHQFLKIQKKLNSSKLESEIKDLETIISNNTSLSLQHSENSKKPLSSELRESYVRNNRNGYE